MDPRQVLLEADARTHLGEYDMALLYLQRYYDMRLVEGKYEPVMEPAFQTGGDDFARMLMTRVKRRLMECRIRTTP